MDWWAANEEEYYALSTAQDGNPQPLAELINTKGQLDTLEARAFVSSLVMGKNHQKAGVKRTVPQQSKELTILMLVRGIQKEFDCGEHRARNVFLDRHPDICNNNETLRTYMRRAKDTLKHAVGRYPPAVVQKGTHSEPE